VVEGGHERAAEEGGEGGEGAGCMWERNRVQHYSGSIQRTTTAGSAFTQLT